MMSSALGVDAAQQTQFQWDFAKDFDGWKQIGTIFPTHTVEQDISWVDQWGGAQGVVVINACDTQSSSGIKKDLTLPFDTKDLIIDAVKNGNDAGIRIYIDNSTAEHILGEEYINGNIKKQFSYDISAWKGQTVTLKIMIFGFGAEACNNEYTGIDKVQITTTGGYESVVNTGTFPGGIIGIDPTFFPKVKVNVFVNTTCAKSGKLKKDDFNVQESGKNMANDSIYFTGNASGRRLDLAIAFDDTGSMGEEISAMKSKVQGLIDQIKTSGMDSRYSLVSFKDSYSIKANWTSDPVAFKASVNSLQSLGGGDEPEVSLDAIESVLSMGFRPDAQKVIILITDAHAHHNGDNTTYSLYSKDEVMKNLMDSGVIFIPVSPTFRDSSEYVDLRDMANEMQSMWIDINSADFSTILERLKGIITGIYVIAYTSPDLSYNTERNITVSVNEPSCDGAVGSATVTYTSLKKGDGNDSTDPNQLYWGFDKNFEGWERTGSIAPWQTIESGIFWTDRWTNSQGVDLGIQGVIVIDACNDASGGIRKNVVLPLRAQNLIANVAKHEMDGTVKFLLTDSTGTYELGEEYLSGKTVKQLSYDVTKWRGKKVTLEVKAIGSGTNTCYGEHIGVDWIKITTADENSKV